LVSFLDWQPSALDFVPERPWWSVAKVNQATASAFGAWRLVLAWRAYKRWF
jgi:hypothetical protein